MIGEFRAAGIIDEEVDPPERVDRRRGESAAGSILDDIGLHRDRTL